MQIDVENLEVRHNLEAKRFEIQLGDQLAMAEYMRGGKNIIFTHTEVPEAYEGLGVANRLAKVALDYAVSEGLRIQPLCPFIKLYVQRHPEYLPHTWGYSPSA